MGFGGWAGLARWTSWVHQVPGETERTVRCWWWIASDGSCRPGAGCLFPLKRRESGWDRAATSTFREMDVALHRLTCGNRL